jgi:hypothetical protein
VILFFNENKGEIVKQLKDSKANDIDVARAVSELKARKHALDNKVLF